MEQLSNCPVCNSATQTPYLKCKDFTVSKDDFSIVKCNSCSFLFTNPRPNASDIGAYYESEDYISHSNSNKGIINRLYQFVRTYTIRQKESLIKKHVSRGTLLDIGCGTGEFLSHMSKNGWTTKGVEPGLKAREFAISNYGLDVVQEHEINNLSSGSFDVITMWHVLEHVHQLNDRVRKLHELLNKNGIVIIAVPNHTSLDARKYAEFWAAYDPPRHLYHFSPETMTKLFENHGFKNIATLPMKFDSYYVSLLSEKYKFGKPSLIAALVMGLRSNLRARFSKKNEYSSQIYLFKKA